MIRINLLPIREEKRKERKRFDISVSVQLLILTFLICSYLYINVYRNAERLHRQVRQKKAEIIHLTQKVGEIKMIKKKKRALKKRIGIIEKLNKRRFQAIKVMEELSRQVPQKIWFKLLQVKRQKLIIEGVALDNQTVSVFISKLNHSKRFYNVWLVQSKEIVLSEIKLKEFSINCNIASE